MNEPAPHPVQVEIDALRRHHADLIPEITRIRDRLKRRLEHRPEDLADALAHSSETFEDVLRMFDLLVAATGETRNTLVRMEAALQTPPRHPLADEIEVLAGMDLEGGNLTPDEIEHIFAHPDVAGEEDTGVVWGSILPTYRQMAALVRIERGGGA